MLNSSCGHHYLNQVYFKTIIDYRIYPTVCGNVATKNMELKNYQQKTREYFDIFPIKYETDFYSCTIILRTISYIIVYANPARSSEKWNVSSTSKTPLCIILCCSYYSIVIFKCCVYNNIITICYNISSRYTIVEVEI